MTPIKIVAIGAAVSAIFISVSLTIALLAADDSLRLLIGYTFVAWLVLAAVLSRVLGMVLD